MNKPLNEMTLEELLRVEYELRERYAHNRDKALDEYLAMAIDLVCEYQLITFNLCLERSTLKSLRI